MTRRSKPTGIFADPRDGIMVRFEDNRYRKITNAERQRIVAALRNDYAHPETAEARLREALADLIEINRRDELGNPDLLATDKWRSQAWSKAKAVVAGCVTNKEGN